MFARHGGCDAARSQLAAWSLVCSYDSLMLHPDSILHQQRNILIGYWADSVWGLYSVYFINLAGAGLELSQEKHHREIQWLFRL